MFSASADYYDLIYSSFKNYADETSKIAALIREKCPAAKTVLDVGCGTGEHVRLLTVEHGFAVDGMDLEPKFAAIAAQKNPNGSFHHADMTAFELHKKYDVVLCLFSSIGYVKSLENVGKTLACFHRHLNPNGIAIVEPWFTPEAWTAGRVFMKTVEKDGLAICRMGHTTLKGSISELAFEYLIGGPDGITRQSERHELGLFTTAEQLHCFRENGFDVTHDEKGLTGRGMFVGKAV